MTAIIRPLFHNSIAESVYESIQNRTSNYYYYLGKILSWDDDTAPEDPIDNIHYENDVRRSMISVKRIDISDVAFIVERRNWTSGTVYDMYDDVIDEDNPAPSGATSIRDATYYVLTEDFNIYKCIFNNDGGQSTTTPTGTDTSYIETADGYVWKFMGFIPLSLRNKFLTSGFMPITKAIKNQYYSDGQIESVTILNGGSDYDPDNTYITISGDGEDADMDPVIENGEITGIIINDSGYGYTTATITVTVGAGDPGEGANIVANLSAGDLDTQQANVELLATDGSLSWIVMENIGSGYTEGSITVTLEGDGTGAAVTPQINVNGEVTGLEITNYGSGYSYLNITITDNQGGEGAVARAIISPQGGHGYDTIRELHSDILCFYTSFEDELNQGVNVDNEFRQVGILQNPRQYGNTQRFVGALGSTCFRLDTQVSLNLPSTIPDDAIITRTSDDATFRVVATEDDAGGAVSGSILVIPISGEDPSTGGTFTYNNNEWVVQSADVTDATINNFSGQLMYIDNRTAFIPTEEQFVIFRSFFRL